nr:SpaA isopeptide-forming pilin-related protein [Bifidobacterium felsineum]
MVAGAMLFVGIPIASAVETAPRSDQSALQECTPGDLDWGGTQTLSTDAGVSVYAGGNMYVGLPPASDHVNGDGGTFSAGSRGYVVESEGVNVVHGSLSGNPGIVLGYVSWGSGHPAPDGMTSLAVGGYANADLWKFELSGSYDASQKKWTGTNGRIGLNNNKIKGSNDHAVYARPGGRVDELMNKSGENVSLSNVNGTDYRNFTDKIKKLSKDLQIQKTDGVVYDNVAFGSVNVQQTAASVVSKWVQGNDGARYEAGADDNGKDDKNNDGISKIWSDVYHQWARYTRLDVKEGKVTFTGDNKPSHTLQVFNLNMAEVNAAMNNNGWTGVYYDFEDIPGNASVVVNVTGANQKGDLTVNTGWQFGWNGVEVGQGYFQSDTAKLFAQASSRIMWNFTDATHTLTIHNGDNWTPFPKSMQKVVDDYPATKGHGDSAATLPGSILAANAAELQDWVSTNGRLLTSGSLFMSQAYQYNDVKSDGNHGYGIGLGLEHHNFPWTGNAITSCPTSGGVEWSKTDTSGQALSGSEWKITKDEAGQDVAVDGIVDNGAHDADALPGSLQVTGLSAGTYYLIETKAPDGYALDSTARQFTVTSGGLAKVNNGKPIQNTRQTGAVAWNKTDTDGQTITSSPSTWTIKGVDGTKTANITGCVIVDRSDGFGNNGQPDDNADGCGGTVRYDEDSDSGEIQVNELPTGQYTLTETKAPDGYTKTDVTYEFTIVADRDGSNPVGIRAEGASDTTDSVANTPKNVSIEWSKKNGLGLDGILLPGAEWTFTQTGASAGSTPFSCTVTDKGAPGAVQGSCKDEDDAAGQFKITFTPNKVVTDIQHPLTYELVETKAPDGYQQVSKPYQVNVWFDKNRGTDGEWVFHWRDLSGEGPITIVNKRIPISALPLTGGRGTARSWILVGGGLALFIVVAGTVWHEWRKRREELLL